MKFRIGPHVYRVHVSDETLTDDDGHPVVSRFSWRLRTITLDGALPLAQRFDALLAALSKVYDEHFGVTETREGQANRSATFAIDVQNQLEKQGGLWALGRLRASGMREARTTDESPNTAYALQCPCCSGSIASGEIQTSEPRFDDALNHSVVDRAATCDFCAVSITWAEAAGSSGKPNGSIVDGPHVRPSGNATRTHQLN